MYTSVKRVRTLSGLDDPTNIPDDNVRSKIVIAGGFIDSAVGYLYSLPLAYHYQNALIFGGTATSGGTLSIAVNAVAYDVAVASGDTPNAIADLFRMAVQDSDDFVTDAPGSGANVLIISKTDSRDAAAAYAEVNVTSAPDSYGLKTTVGTRAKRYPVIIEQIAAEIATALLFIDIYGIESQDTGKDGTKRMEAIDAMLQKLQGAHESGQSIKVFDEVTHAEIAQASGLVSISYPNDTSETDTTDPTSPKAFMNKTF